MLSTHRLIFVKDNDAVEIPLHYVGKVKGDGGWVSSYRIEVSINSNTREWSPHIIEHYQKVLEQEVPPVSINFGDSEYHFKKFPNKESRNKFLGHIEES